MQNQSNLPKKLGADLGLADSPAQRGKVMGLWRDYLAPLSAHSTIGQLMISQNRAIEWEGCVVPTHDSAKEQAVAAAAARAAAAVAASAGGARAHQQQQQQRGKGKLLHEQQ